MALEEDIARLVTAADRLTEVVDNKVDEIDAEVAAFKAGTIIQEGGGLYFEQYDTGSKNINLGAKPANLWIPIPIKVTVNQDGLYAIFTSIRQWSSVNTGYQWNKYRVKVADEQRRVVFGFNKNNLNSNIDLTVGATFVTPAKAGDVIAVDVYWQNVAPASLYIGDINGSSSLLAIKVGNLPEEQGAEL
ncbi:hypothetical protein K6Q96_08920 [Grimontia kaedaensis]|uniref:DUF1983 domain-containing protein n=1 Tax=Grimontia kaedaensis TaxID=2872157 RepID=A0ABY4WPF6_9GAMM|nr:hypothetical protein [Grimontia kaedaensis]USH01062.1 hypothetical protein K6Q96_08920 [Grimontia kaedaensis]